MKATFEISDALLNEVRQVASEEDTTVRFMVEEGLRRMLKDRKKTSYPFKLKLVTFRGQGLRSGLNWDLPRSLAYHTPIDDSE